MSGAHGKIRQDTKLFPGVGRSHMRYGQQSPLVEQDLSPLCAVLARRNQDVVDRTKQLRLRQSSPPTYCAGSGQGVEAEFNGDTIANRMLARSMSLDRTPNSAHQGQSAHQLPIGPTQCELEDKIRQLQSDRLVMMSKQNHVEKVLAAKRLRESIVESLHSLQQPSSQQQQQQRQQQQLRQQQILPQVTTSGMGIDARIALARALQEVPSPVVPSKPASQTLLELASRESSGSALLDRMLLERHHQAQQARQAPAPASNPNELSSLPLLVLRARARARTQAMLDEAAAASPQLVMSAPMASSSLMQQQLTFRSPHGGL
eukprot:CAMPEP_0198123108 /NCGR_PEP_ID=MMETSP1442-20131203/36686_1 /TAXON_ID= /ORGANISM="Craspedostauros australis, Strain CCMP3328" /LENGTH=317 /DNA_ID=CAMNT_0043782263 /DNA_START=60 /DNA_END=1013 /DNA_ORIENTATION=-